MRRLAITKSIERMKTLLANVGGLDSSPESIATEAKLRIARVKPAQVEKESKTNPDQT